MSALEREIAAAGPKMAAKPRVTYLYDKNAVAAGTIEKALEAAAPRLRDLADVEIVPTDGLTYYKLKNFGIARAKTDISIMLDSDAAPQPGWLEGLLKPFADPEIDGGRRLHGARLRRLPVEDVRIELDLRPQGRARQDRQAREDPRQQLRGADRLLPQASVPRSAGVQEAVRLLAARPIARAVSNIRARPKR